jgi:hypothetical protein
MKTECPAGETWCPASETECPPHITWCPKADTWCPFEEVYCPTVELELVPDEVLNINVNTELTDDCPIYNYYVAP